MILSDCYIDKLEPIPNTELKLIVGFSGPVMVNTGVRVSRSGYVYNPVGGSIRSHRVALLKKIHESHGKINTTLFPEATPIEVNLNIYLVRPTRTKTVIVDTPCTHVPDVDNIAKCYLDVLKGIVFPDDMQVTNLHVRKLWAKRNELINSPVFPEKLNLLPAPMVWIGIHNGYDN